MKKGNAGYSLVEIVIAMALLAIITIPTYTCLNMSVKINAAADQLLKAQLAVSSAVETLMAEGIDPSKFDANTGMYKDSRFPDVAITQKKNENEEVVSNYYIIYSNKPGTETVTVTTYIPEGGDGA